MEKEKIEFTEFLEIEKKLEIRIGLITSVERVEKSKKLLKLVVQFHPDNGDTRTVVTNLGGQLEPSTLLGRQLPFITNLKPATMMGIVSEAMIVVGESFVGEIELGNYSIGTKLL